MTIFDAAKPRHETAMVRVRSWLAPRGAVAVATCLAALALAGCEAGTSILGGNTPETPIAQPQQAPTPQPASYRVALAPIIGAPESTARQLATLLTQAGERQRVSILSDRDAKGQYTLRGYIVAARDKAGTKISYIWDLTDSAGKRVNRITGEEVAAAAPNAKDPWSGVTPVALQNITDRTMGELGKWLAQQPPPATPVASPAQPPPAAGVGANPATVPPPVAQAPAPTPPASPQTTAAIPPGNEQVVSVVPVVTGAPGDGNTALAAAIQRELARQGITVSQRPGAYRIEGQVTLGALKDGRQPIQIDWRVRDAQGKSLGTVSQKNEIPPGSLDGPWGKTADAAAAAAAQGIIKLLPQPRASN